ncbi:MAG: PAC2 family protein [Chloroflexi bacterium]|nr:PAC2 family protein [Chloroflexota bacterium]
MTESEILRRLEDVGTLHKPLLVASFVRKNGINTTAAAALMHRIRSHDLQPIAQFDPEQFFDFTQSRPQVRNEDGGRVIEFPRNRVHLERATEGGRDALIVSGIEPHLRWRHFSEELTSFARSVDVEAVLILRSFPANVPHTRPVLLRLTTTSEELSGELGLPQLQPSYEGPIDIGEVVASELAASGVAIGGMTVLVPNYLGVVPNPMAVLGVTRTLDRLIGAETPTGQYEEAADNVRAQADEQMQASAEVREAVEAMEEQYESIAGGGGDEDDSGLPSVSDLLEDVERFLSNEGDRPS